MVTTELRLRAFVDRLQGKCATLLLGDEGEQVVWPAKLLPEGAVEGSVMFISIDADEAAANAAEEVINSLIDRLERGQ